MTLNDQEIVNAGNCRKREDLVEFANVEIV